jgi:hypothetical protein
MNVNSFENKYCQLWIENGILFFVYKKGLELTLEDAITIVKDRLDFQKGKAYPVFCDFRGVLTGSKAARDYLANEGSELISTVALLISSPVMRVVVNFYLKIDKPKVPTVAFTEKDKALDYLNKYVEQNV